VLELNEALKSPQVEFNQTVQDVGTKDHPCATVRCPVRSKSWPFRDTMTPPKMGEHSEEVLEEVLGLSVKDVEGLLATGSVAGRGA
jgi:crotonobetainyl-CoA:carnitine CoA-transferase CaiB-like acyl-CoA transferase